MVNETVVGYRKHGNPLLDHGMALSIDNFACNHSTGNECKIDVLDCVTLVDYY